MKSMSSSTISFESLQKLITCIYDAALNEKQWENVLNKLAFALNADQGHMRILNLNSRDIQKVHTFNKDPSWTQAYNDYYINVDHWVDYYCLKPDKTIFNCTHHLLSDRECASTELYQDFSAPQGIHYGIGGKIYINNNSSCYITFQRPKNHHGFETKYLHTLNSLAPHITKAVLINQKTSKIELEKELLDSALENINNPLCMVSKQGNILYINSTAEQLINGYEGVSIRNNCIYFTDNKANNLFLSLIQQATSNIKSGSFKKGGAMCHNSPINASPLSILVSPVNADKTNLNTQTNEVALLLFNNNSKIALTEELLTSLYNFTPAEAKLTFYLCQGLTLDEISEKISKSKNTLRSQLRSSFSRVGVSRQSDLINLINTGPAGALNNIN